MALAFFTRAVRKVKTSDGKIAVGWLIVEDLAIVLTLILERVKGIEPFSSWRIVLQRHATACSTSWKIRGRGYYEHHSKWQNRTTSLGWSQRIYARI
jgi:hypothetical protein